jgi:HlyD family secretion protein
VEEAEIASQIVGRVIEVRIKDGDRVKRGDLLVKLDPTEAKARVDSAAARCDRLRSAIDQARRDLEKATRDEALSTKLAGRGVTTLTELADSRTSKSKAEISLKMCANDLVESEAMRLTSQQELIRTAILSPIDGVVAGLSVDVGEVVIAGTTNLKGSVLMTVSDMKRLRVRAEVDETDVPLVRPGQPSKVFLQADEKNPVAGTVDRVAPKGTKKDEVVSFETLVNIAEDQPVLRPGMSSTVEIEVRRADRVLSVPVQAVVHRRRKDLPDSPTVRAWTERNAHSPGEKAQEAELRYVKIVFVVVGDVARARPVETGLSDERRIEIVSGVGPEERVVVAPFRALDELKDGSPVIPVKVLTEGGGRG